MKKINTLCVVGLAGVMLTGGALEANTPTGLKNINLDAYVSSGQNLIQKREFVGFNPKGSVRGACVVNAYMSVDDYPQIEYQFKKSSRQFASCSADLAIYKLGDKTKTPVSTFTLSIWNPGYGTWSDDNYTLTNPGNVRLHYAHDNVFTIDVV